MTGCKVEGCLGGHKAHGWCGTHYAYWRRTGKDPAEAPARLPEGFTTKNKAEYVIWRGALQRCYDVNFHNYNDYGGRGILVCNRWRFGESGKHPFICFFEDMGSRPTPKHTLEREDNDKGYSPDNCYWATRKEQANNRRFRANTTGYPGAQLCRDKFKAQIRVDGVTIHLGVFDSAAEASVAWLQAKASQSGKVKTDVRL